MPDRTDTKHPKDFEEARKEAGNAHMAYYILSAIKLGISYKVLIRGLFVEFEKGGTVWRIHKALTPVNDSVAMSLVSYKNTCNRFLRDSGFPVPAQAHASSAEDIFDFMKKHKTEEIVVKPTRGFGGAGVSIQPKSDEEIRHAFNLAEEKCMSSKQPKVLVEEFVYGRHFRMFVLGDKLIAAAERMPPYVVGDGKSTIERLVDLENEHLGDEGRPTIKLDEESDKALEVYGFSLDSVPKKDEKVIVRFNANMTSGGSTRECLAEIHPEYQKMAVNVVQATGLKVGGLDLITPDISDPKVKYAINEVNHNPGLRIHYMPDHGEPIDVATQVQQYILDNI